MADLMTTADRKRLAALAASQASEAVVSLLRFATSEHDETLNITQGGEEVELLLDAAAATLEIIIAERQHAGDPVDEDLNQVLGAIARFLEGWA